MMFLVFSAGATSAQTTVFTYQGRLNSDIAPVNGDYQLQFKLFDAESGGNQIGQTLTDVTATVTDGVFVVRLDFGAASFNGSDRYLEVGVRPLGSSAEYAPDVRRQVTSAPYAIRSLKAEQADYANTAGTASNTTNLGGVPAAQFTQTNDSRLSDARSPLPGSASYIQNTQNQQSSANFNISGEGKANKFNATAQYDINGNRVLSVAGTDNVIVGVDAGKVTTGGFNAFVGKESGRDNTSGFNNSFFGAYSGRANTTGTNNAFVGANAGLSNNIGSSNSFVGSNAGFANTSGSSNSFFGNSSGLNNSTGLNNSFFGRSSGAGVTNAGSNSFFGAYSGENTTTGGNSYFGAFTGQKNTTGINNSFFGLNAGKENTGGSNNTYIGSNTGQPVGATGSNNTFIGSTAGQVSYFGAISGSNNTAIGFNARVAGGVNNATAIGANALAESSNSIELGAASTKVNIPGALEVDGGASFGGSLAAATSLSALSLNISNGKLFTTVENSTFKLKLPGGRIEASGINGGVVSGSSANFEGAVEALGFAWTKFPSVGAANQKVCYYQNSQGVTALAPCSSSIRYKDNVQNFTGGLSLLNRFRPVTYNWKLNGQKDLGFIAEEVNAIEPLLTNYNEKGEIEGVRYDLITTVLVNAVKEQQEQIKQQQEQIKQQQAQIEALKMIICNGKKNAVCSK